MAFEWQRFCEQNGIEFAQGGANTSRDNITVHCPFCGSADPSQHMSINLQGKGWRCWRHPQHRGKNPARLVQALLNCDWQRASQIVGQAIYVPSDFLDRVRGTINPPKIEKRPGLKVPSEFKRFQGLPSELPYANYLYGRGFTDEEIAGMSSRYSMRYCTSGPFRGRIIFLVRYTGELVAWTGRSISKYEELRYKALSVDPERTTAMGYEAALGPISHYLLWWDRLQNVDADTIVLCEGPFDALKVDVLGRRFGICATCFFTSSPTDAQIDLLHELCPQFKKRILLLDKGTFALGMRVVSRLSGLGVRTYEIEHGLKDPGEHTPETFERFALAVDRVRA